MPKSLVLLTAAAFMATLSGSATIADAKPKKPAVQFCSIKGGRAPCDWVERCLLDGGIPERRPFTGKLVCKMPVTAAPKAH